MNGIMQFDSITKQVKNTVPEDRGDLIMDALLDGGIFVCGNSFSDN